MTMHPGAERCDAARILRRGRGLLEGERIKLEQTAAKEFDDYDMTMTDMTHDHVISCVILVPCRVRGSLVAVLHCSSVATSTSWNASPVPVACPGRFSRLGSQESRRSQAGIR